MTAKPVVSFWHNYGELHSNMKTNRVEISDLKAFLWFSSGKTKKVGDKAHYCSFEQTPYWFRRRRLITIQSVFSDFFNDTGKQFLKSRNAMLLCSFNGRVVFVKKVFGLGRDHDSCAFAGFCCCFVRRVKHMVTSASHPPISLWLRSKTQNSLWFFSRIYSSFSISRFMFLHTPRSSLLLLKKNLGQLKIET